MHTHTHTHTHTPEERKKEEKKRGGPAERERKKQRVQDRLSDNNRTGGEGERACVVVGGGERDQPGRRTSASGKIHGSCNPQQVAA